VPKALSRAEGLQVETRARDSSPGTPKPADPA
jgi:hypothetical protein